MATDDDFDEQRLRAKRDEYWMAASELITQSVLQNRAFSYDEQCRYELLLAAIATIDHRIKTGTYFKGPFRVVMHGE